jgi:sec-independent protein translocase protein TatA
MDLGPAEIGLILLAVMLLFGYKKMPDAARSLGRSLRIFKSEMNAAKTEPPAPAPAEAPAVEPPAPSTGGATAA